MYNLLTKHDVKMAGYWPCKYLHYLHFFMDQDKVRVHKNAEKKDQGQYPAILTEQAWSINAKEFCFCGNKADNPE